MPVYRNADGSYEHDYRHVRHANHPDGPGEKIVTVKITHAVRTLIKQVPAKKRKLVHACWFDHDTIIPKSGEPAQSYRAVCWAGGVLQTPNLAVATEDLTTVDCPTCVRDLSEAQPR